MVNNAKATIVQFPQPAGLGINNPCSRAIQMHYSFYFAQQVHIPSDPLQPGPVYFLVPRKCGLFGINCEGLPQQVNYLIDEAASSSKGSNAVISYLHHFFKTYGLGETDLLLHCDNCSGQNKNRYMLWYLAWRVMHGLHQTISLNFLITGHTKFAPDWCFGLVKQRFRKVRVCSLDELSDVVRTSTATGVNIPQLVMSSNGDMNVIQCDWQKLQEYFKPLTGIMSYQHFRFSAQSPGVVFCKQYINTPDELEVQFNMLKSKNMPPFEEPAVIPPPGLSAKRQWYWYDSIRDFCTDESMDITGPRPSLPNPDADDFGDDHAPQAAAVAQNQENRGCGTRGR